MITAWQISSKRYADTAFTGEGTIRVGTNEPKRLKVAVDAAIEAA